MQSIFYQFSYSLRVTSSKQTKINRIERNSNERATSITLKRNWIPLRCIELHFDIETCCSAKKTTWRNSLNCAEEWRWIEKTAKKNGWRRKKQPNEIEEKKKNWRKEITYFICRCVCLCAFVFSLYDSASRLHFDCSYKKFAARARLYLMRVCVRCMWFCFLKKKKQQFYASDEDTHWIVPVCIKKMRGVAQQTTYLTCAQ